MLGSPCQSWRLQWRLPSPPQLPASPACPIWSGLLTAPQHGSVLMQPYNEKSKLSVSFETVHCSTTRCKFQYSKHLQSKNCMYFNCKNLASDLRNPKMHDFLHYTSKVPLIRVAQWIKMNLINAAPHKHISAWALSLGLEWELEALIKQLLLTKGQLKGFLELK